MMQKLNCIRCGDYYIPDIRLPKENRPIGRWGRLHRDYIKEHNPIRFNDLCLSSELWTYLADLNEQAQNYRRENESCWVRDRGHEAVRSDGIGKSLHNRAEENCSAWDDLLGRCGMRILEEFWYGNIAPTEYDTSSKEYKKLLELICRNEEKLKTTMTDEQKELFEKYTDCLIFQNSFKLESIIMLEVME